MRTRIRKYLIRFMILIGVLTVLNPGSRMQAGERRDSETRLPAKIWPTLYLLAEMGSEGALSPYAGKSPKIPQAPSIPVTPRVEPVPLPAQVKGVYVTGWGAGTPSLFSKLIDFIDQTDINTLVIEFKDDRGFLSYLSTVPLAREIESGRAKIGDIPKLLQTLKDHGIYPIARVSVFKDSVLAEKRPKLAVQDQNGGIWRDELGLAWVDPASREAWDYNVAIAAEIADMGFPEIQFDYVRYPDVKAGQDKCVYPLSGTTVKEDVIREFLAYAGEKLKAKKVIVSADIFGLVCSAQSGLGIGQQLEKLAEVTEILSPMVYPSHYYKGSYGLADPDLHPYETVYRSLTDARRRTEGLPVKFRPWLQAFSLGNNYGREQIFAQIQAVRDAGFNDWLFWHAGGKYNIADFPARGEEVRYKPASVYGREVTEGRLLPAEPLPERKTPAKSQKVNPSPVTENIKTSGFRIISGSKGTVSVINNEIEKE